MIEAVNKSIIVKAVYAERKSGLLLPGDEKPVCYEIISNGEEVKCVQPGDKVFMAPYGLQEINYQGNKYYVCQSDNILAKNVL